MSYRFSLTPLGSLLAAAALLTGCASGEMDFGGMDGGGMAFKVPAGAELMTDEVFLYYNIPNIPPSAEAYFAPDSYHLIAQTKDSNAAKSSMGTMGNLTYTYSIDGTDLRRANDKGMDACSYSPPRSTAGGVHFNPRPHGFAVG